MNKPTYKIHGQERKILKSRLAKLNAHIQSWWHFEDIDEAYGMKVDKKESQKELDQLIKEKEELEQRLSVLYI